MFKAVTAGQPQPGVACTVFSVLILSTQENVGKISFATVFVQYLLSLIDVLDTVLVYRGFVHFEIIHVFRYLGKYFFIYDLFCHWPFRSYDIKEDLSAQMGLPRAQCRESVCLKTCLMSTLFQHYTWMNPVFYPWLAVASADWIY